MFSDEHDYSPEHPDDKVSREQSMKQAEPLIDAFIAKLPPDTLKKLIMVWGDGYAHDDLDQIREDFWTSIPNDEPGAVT